MSRTRRACGPSRTANGIGLTWAFGQYCYVYRSDLVSPAPTSFESFWEERFASVRGTYITSNTLFMAFFMTANGVFGRDQYDMEAGFQAMRDAAPMKISDFTGNMQTLLERGEVEIGVQVDGEVYMQKARGISVEPYIWQEFQPILTQTKTISRYSDPIQKRLAFALMNRTLDPEFITRFTERFWLRPTHRDAVVPENLAAAGVVNSADATNGLWIPDWSWYIENENRHRGNRQRYFRRLTRVARPCAGPPLPEATPLVRRKARGSAQDLTMTSWPWKARICKCRRANSSRFSVRPAVERRRRSGWSRAL